MTTQRLWAYAVVFTAASLSVGAHGAAMNIGQDTPNIVGDSGVSFTGTIDYTANSATNGALAISLTNTSSIGGFITGFVFNAGGESVTTSLTSSSFASFLNLTNASAVPFGSSFLGGAALGANWLGGGSPSNGIGVGQTGSFVFDVNGSGAGSLTSGSFLTGPYDFNFIVRFRGTGGPEGSSKAPAMPAPGGAAAILGAAAFAGTRRRR